MSLLRNFLTDNWIYIFFFVFFIDNFLIPDISVSYVYMFSLYLPDSTLSVVVMSQLKLVSVILLIGGII